MYNIKKVKNSIIHGNALSILKEFPSDSIDCFVTSSPYYGLRTYDTSPQIWGGNPNCNHTLEDHIQKPKGGRNLPDNMPNTGNDRITQKMDNPRFGVKSQFCSICNAWIGELGQEPSHLMFIDHLVEIYMECARVLKPEGTMWLNIADSYSGSNQGNGADASGKQATVRGTTKMQTERHKSILSKSDIPAKSLMCIPDRLKIALVDKGLICRNEIIWHRPNQMPSSVKDRFTNDYEKLYFFTKSKKYFFQQQLEPYAKPMNRWGGDNLEASGKSDWDNGTGQETYRTRNMRPNPDGKNMRTVWSINTKPNKVAHFATFPQALPERCILAGCPKGGIVLDPFFGSGTTGLVAKKNNRNYIGIDLNQEYINIAEGILN